MQKLRIKLRKKSCPQVRRGTGAWAVRWSEETLVHMHIREKPLLAADSEPSFTIRPKLL